MNSDRYERQVRLFGEDGQKKLQATRVAVAGVGGIGSHVVQQLVYLGVQEITLIDMDELAKSNRNRLIGSFDRHKIGKSKIKILKSLAKNINSKITVSAIPESIDTHRSQKAISECDFVFSCFDNDGPRSFINELVHAFEVPCIDIASGIHVDSMDYGGRLIYIDSEGCLICLNELDQNEIRSYFESSEQREDTKKVYGVYKSLLKDSGPSVVSINGVVASLAVTEFMLSTTGIRNPRKYLFYDGKTGGVRFNSTKPQSGCYFCNSVRGNRRFLDNY